GELRLPDEARAKGLVVGELGNEDLQRHTPVESLVRGQVDRAHTTATEYGLDPVSGERLADTNCAVSLSHSAQSRTRCSRVPRAHRLPSRERGQRRGQVR